MIFDFLSTSNERRMQDILYIISILPNIKLPNMLVLLAG